MSSRPVNVRLAFNFAKWAPTKQQYCLAISCIQPEERDRIRRFRFVSTSILSISLVQVLYNLDLSKSKLTKLFCVAKYVSQKMIEVRHQTVGLTDALFA